MLVQLTPDFQNGCHHLGKDVWCDLGEAQRSTMGGKESKQFPISYDEASKRGAVKIFPNQIFVPRGFVW